MSLYDGLIKYYSNFGVRGVVAAASNRLLGAPTEIVARPKALRWPVRIRIRSTDFDVYNEIVFANQYDLDMPMSPKVIVDGGANIGLASVYFANKFPAARIIAVEAEASNFEVLLRNVAPYPAIVPIHAALWNRDGEIGVSEPDPTKGVGGEWAFVTQEGGGGARVRAITMRTLMREMEIDAIDLAKIDIEGAEVEVFEDTSWVRSARCLMVELHDTIRPGCTEAVDAAAAGYARSQHGETTLYVQPRSVSVPASSARAGRASR